MTALADYVTDGELADRSFRDEYFTGPITLYAAGPVGVWESRLWVDEGPILTSIEVDECPPGAVPARRVDFRGCHLEEVRFVTYAPRVSRWEKLVWRVRRWLRRPLPSDVRMVLWGCMNWPPRSPASS